MGRRQTRIRPTAKPALLVAAGGGVLLLAAGLYLALLGGPVVPEAVGGPWTLVAGNGVTVTDRDFRGRFLLIYFGYTSCPDICPATLAAMAQAMHRLGTGAQNLQPLFITVDPAHDTPAVMRQYTGRFGMRLLGLTGSTAQIAAIEEEYHIEATLHGPGAVDHSSVLLLVGPDGHYRAPLPADLSGDQLAARLEGLL